MTTNQTNEPIETITHENRGGLLFTKKETRRTRDVLVEITAPLPTGDRPRGSSRSRSGCGGRWSHTGSRAAPRP